MSYLILINLLLFSAGQLVTITRNGGLNIYLFDIFLFFSNFVIFRYLMKRGKFKINFPLISFILFILFSFSITLFQIYYFDFLSQFLILSYLIRFSSYFFFGYFVYLLVLNKLVTKDTLKRILTINFWFLTALNALQLVFLNNLIELAQFGWDPHINRLTGSFLDPNFMAFYLCLYFILNKYFLHNKYIEYLTIISIFLTVSRNGILTFLIVLLLSAKLTIKKIIYFFIIMILLLMFVPQISNRFTQFSDSNDSSYQRLISWNEGLKVANFSNFWGVGFNNYRNSAQFYKINSGQELTKNSSNSVDSSLLFILITTGAIGLGIFVLHLFSFTFQDKLIWQNIVLVVGLLFNSLFINSLFYPQTCLLLYLSLFIGLLEEN
jgi:hypothetical protein